MVYRSRDRSLQTSHILRMSMIRNPMKSGSYPKKFLRHRPKMFADHEMYSRSAGASAKTGYIVRQCVSSRSALTHQSVEKGDRFIFPHLEKNKSVPFFTVVSVIRAMAFLRLSLPPL